MKPNQLFEGAPIFWARTAYPEAELVPGFVEEIGHKTVAIRIQGPDHETFVRYVSAKVLLPGVGYSRLAAARRLN